MKSNTHPFKLWCIENNVRTKDTMKYFKFGYMQMIRILTYKANPTHETIDIMAQLMAQAHKGSAFNEAVGEIVIAHRKGQVVSNDLMDEV